MCSAKVDVLNVSKLSEAEVEHFSQLVGSLKIHSIFQNPRWGLVMHDSFGYDPYLLLLYDADGKVIASLLFLMDRGSRRTQSIDGPCLDYPTTQTDVLIRLYKKVAFLIGAERVEFRMLPSLRSSENLQVFSFRGVKYLNKPLDDIWKSLNRKSVRSMINRAIRSGVKIHEAEKPKDYLDHIKLSYKSKIYGGLSLYDPEVRGFYKVINSIASHLKNNHKLFLANVDGNVIATVLWLYDDHLAYYYDVGLDRRYVKYSAPDYLMWYSIERLHALGIKIIDLMGLNPFHSSSHFKKKYSDKILLNRGFIVSKPKFFIYYIRHYPYSIINFRTYLQSMLKHKLLNFL
jgi:lipid II:glycine glycyltransferase (peptidoglycan interpeptide bridge formation enzyme)